MFTHTSHMRTHWLHAHAHVSLCTRTHWPHALATRCPHSPTSAPAPVLPPVGGTLPALCRGGSRPRHGISGFPREPSLPRCIFSFSLFFHVRSLLPSSGLIGLNYKQRLR